MKILEARTLCNTNIFTGFILEDKDGNKGLCVDGNLLNANKVYVVENKVDIESNTELSFVVSTNKDSFIDNVKISRVEELEKPSEDIVKLFNTLK